MNRPIYKPRTNVVALLALLLAATTVIANFGAAYAATLTSASVSLSDSRPSTASVTYAFQASNVTLSTIKCIKVVFSDTATGTNVPASMTTTSAAVTGNYVPTPASWTADASVNGTIKYTYATGETPASASARTLNISGITNGNTANTPYFMQVNTYNNTDCSSSPVDAVTVQFVYTSGQQVSASVDPTLTFTVAGVTGNGTLAVNGTTITNGLATTATTIPFGTVTSSTNKVAGQDLTVTTNAGNGYTVYIRSTGALTSGGNTIADFPGGSNSAPNTFSAAGTAGFGYTTSDTTLGTGTASRFSGGKWAALTGTNAEIAYNNAAISSDLTHIGYQVGIAGTTPAGGYTTTVVYTATPVY